MRNSVSSSDGSTREKSGISESNICGKGRDELVDGDEEKEIGLGEAVDHTKGQEIASSRKSRSRRRGSQDSKSLRRVESHHSRAGADGYTWHHDGDQSSQQPNRAKAGVVIPEPYLVSFDGDADPENPRSMTSLRRWAIVLICAASSLCV